MSDKPKNNIALPVGVFIALIGLAVSGVFWGGSIDTKADVNALSIARIEKQYQQQINELKDDNAVINAELKSEIKNLDQHVLNLTTKDSEVDARLVNVENSLKEIKDILNNLTKLLHEIKGNG